MHNNKEAITPMPTNCYLDANENLKVIESTKFRGMIVSISYTSQLAYLTSCSMYACLEEINLMLRNHNIQQQNKS